MKVVAGIIGGLVFALIVYFVIGISSIAKESTNVMVGSLLLPWGIGIFVAVRAPSAAKAWRRLLISSGVAALCLPLAGLVFTGTHISAIDQGAAYSTARTAGAVIGGTLVSGFLGFVGMFLGAIFLVVGLLIGRDKQVVYVQAPVSGEQNPLAGGPSIK